jgi:hypothetical protein
MAKSDKNKKPFTKEIRSAVCDKFFKKYKDEYELISVLWDALYKYDEDNSYKEIMYFPPKAFIKVLYKQIDKISKNLGELSKFVGYLENECASLAMKYPEYKISIDGNDNDLEVLCFKLTRPMSKEEIEKEDSKKVDESEIDIDYNSLSTKYLKHIHEKILDELGSRADRKKG